MSIEDWQEAFVRGLIDEMGRFAGEFEESGGAAELQMAQFLRTFAMKWGVSYETGIKELYDRMAEGEGE